MKVASFYSTPQSCEELLAQMVAHDTVNPLFGGNPQGEAVLIAYLEQLAQGWGLRTRRCPVPGGRENLLITCEVAPEARWLIFESHLDTVSVADMTIEPFTLKTEKGRLYGRGTCDTKGSGAAMLWALQQYAQSAHCPRNIALAFISDEEAFMSGAQAFAASVLPELLIQLDGVIVGEPTGLSPVVAHNGVMRWKTITHGIAAHSSIPANGRSAISAMLRVVDALESRYTPTVNRSHPLTGRAAISVNVIHGGTQVNIIPAHCEIECDRRLVPGETAVQVLAERDAVLSGHEVEHAELFVVPPLGGEHAASLMERLRPLLVGLGLSAAERGAPYVTDASHYAAVGAPTIVLGPGNLAQAHTKDEWLEQNQLTLATRLYAALMMSA